MLCVGCRRWKVELNVMIEVKAMKVEYLELKNHGAGRDVLPERVYVEVLLGEDSVGNMSGIFGGSLTSDLSVPSFALSISVFS